MKRALVHSAILAAIALVSGPAEGQTPSRSPEEVAADVLRADSLHDWRLLLALAHPEALRNYREDQVRMLKSEDFPGMADMAPCLRKYHRSLLDSVFRVPTPDSLSRVAPDTVFARVQRFFARQRGPRAPIDSLLPTRAILGHVVADDSTVYVIFEERYARRPLPDWPERRPQVMTFRLYRGGWRTMLDPDLGSGLGPVMFEGGDCP